MIRSRTFAMNNKVQGVFVFSFAIAASFVLGQFPKKGGGEGTLITYN